MTFDMNCRGCGAPTQKGKPCCNYCGRENAVRPERPILKPLEIRQRSNIVRK